MSIIRFSFFLAVLAAAASSSAHARGSRSSASASATYGKGGGVAAAPQSSLDKDFFGKVQFNSGGGGSYMAVETPLEQDRKFDNAGPRGFFNSR